MDSKASAVSRFLGRLRPDPASECILFDGALNEKGYGRMWVPVSFYDEIETRYIRAHRFAYHALRAPLDPNDVLDHLCGTKDCCNPYHLEAVPTSVNAARANITKYTGFSSEEQRLAYLAEEEELWG